MCYIAGGHDLFRGQRAQKELEPLAEEFYESLLRPDEEPRFASDDALLLDISLAPEEPLIRRIKTHYGKTVTGSDLRKSFWVLLMNLNENRTVK